MCTQILCNPREKLEEKMATGSQRSLAPTSPKNICSFSPFIVRLTGKFANTFSVIACLIHDVSLGGP